MAVSKLMVARSMQRKELTGVSEEGKATYQSRTISNLNKTLTTEEIAIFNILLGRVVNISDAELIEKVSYTIA